MSCAWDVKCVTCDVAMGMSDANHGLEFMHLLIENAAAIAALAKFVGAVGLYPFLELGSSDGTVNVAFMAAHRGHKLVPFDEYGRRADECGERVRCGTCGSEKRCVLPPDHDPGTSHAFKQEK